MESLTRIGVVIMAITALGVLGFIAISIVPDFNMDTFKFFLYLFGFGALLYVVGGMKK